MKGTTMKKFALLGSLGLISCGSIEGNWDGSCENQATGEGREFSLDIDVDSRSGIEGTAFMTSLGMDGTEEIVDCVVLGEKSAGVYDLDFSCDNGEEFSIDFEKDGGDLVGYCDSADTYELRLVLD